MKSLQEMHNEVLDFLLKVRESQPDFMFRLRRIDRGGRLSKGYWFLGSDSYMVLSFWGGSDRMTKLPRASFIIHHKGPTTFKLFNADTSEPGEIFSDGLINDLGLSPFPTDKGFEKPYTRYKNNEYLKSLADFISNEKQELDRQLINDTIHVPVAELAYVRPIIALNPFEFEKDLQKIIGLRKDFEKTQILNTKGFLSSIKVQCYKKIKEIHVDDLHDNKWIFLTGENGKGKTTFLQALTIALANYNFGTSDEVKDLKIEIGIDKKIITLNDETFSENKPTSMGFAAYGPIRIIQENPNQHNLDKKSMRKIAESDAYGLFNQFDVLHDLSNVYNLNSRRVKEVGLDLEYLIEHLQYILPDILYVEYDKKKKGLLFYEKVDPELSLDQDPDNHVGPKSFEHMSSGNKSIALLILDIILRFKKQQPNASDPADYEGIIVIDEIENHLHPKRQVEIVQLLDETFPKIQFIVSTHSPIPLLGAPLSSKFLLFDWTVEKGIEAKELKLDISNLLPNTLLTSPIFGMETVVAKSNQNTKEINVDNHYDDMDLFKRVDKKIDELFKQSNWMNSKYFK